MASGVNSKGQVPTDGKANGVSVPAKAPSQPSSFWHYLWGIATQSSASMLEAVPADGKLVPYDKSPAFILNAQTPEGKAQVEQLQQALANASRQPSSGQTSSSAKPGSNLSQPVTAKSSDAPQLAAEFTFNVTPSSVQLVSATVQQPAQSASNASAAPSGAQGISGAAMQIAASPQRTLGPLAPSAPPADLTGAEQQERAGKFITTLGKILGVAVHSSRKGERFISFAALEEKIKAGKLDASRLSGLHMLVERTGTITKRELTQGDVASYLAEDNGLSARVKADGFDELLQKIKTNAPDAPVKPATPASDQPSMSAYKPTPWQKVKDALTPPDAYHDIFVARGLGHRNQLVDGDKMDAELGESKAPNTTRQKIASFVQVPGSLPALPATIYRAFTGNNDFSEEGTAKLPAWTATGEQWSKNIWNNTTGGVPYELSMKADQNNGVAMAATTVLSFGGEAVPSLSRAAVNSARPLVKAATAAAKASPSVRVLVETLARGGEIIDETAAATRQLLGKGTGMHGPGGMISATAQGIGDGAIHTLPKVATGAPKPGLLATLPAINTARQGLSYMEGEGSESHASPSRGSSDAPPPAGDEADTGSESAPNSSKSNGNSTQTQSHAQSQSSNNYKQIQAGELHFIKRTKIKIDNYLKGVGPSKTSILERLDEEEERLNAMLDENSQIMSEATSESNKKIRRSWVEDKLDEVKGMRREIENVDIKQVEDAPDMQQIKNKPEISAKKAASAQYYLELQGRIKQVLKAYKKCFEEYKQSGIYKKQDLLDGLAEEINELKSQIKNPNGPIEAVDYGRKDIMQNWLGQKLKELENLHAEIDATDEVPLKNGFEHQVPKLYKIYPDQQRIADGLATARSYYQSYLKSGLPKNDDILGYIGEVKKQIAALLKNETITPKEKKLLDEGLAKLKELEEAVRRAPPVSIKYLPEEPLHLLKPQNTDGFIANTKKLMEDVRTAVDAALLKGADKVSLAGEVQNHIKTLEKLDDESKWLLNVADQTEKIERKAWLEHVIAELKKLKQGILGTAEMPAKQISEPVIQASSEGPPNIAALEKESNPELVKKSSSAERPPEKITAADKPSNAASKFNEETSVKNASGKYLPEIPSDILTPQSFNNLKTKVAGIVENCGTSVNVALKAGADKAALSAEIESYISTLNKLADRKNWFLNNADEIEIIFRQTWLRNTIEELKSIQRKI